MRISLESGIVVRMKRTLMSVLRGVIIGAVDVG